MIARRKTSAAPDLRKNQQAKADHGRVRMREMNLLSKLYGRARRLEFAYSAFAKPSQFGIAGVGAPACDVMPEGAVVKRRNVLIESGDFLRSLQLPRLEL